MRRSVDPVCITPGRTSLHSRGSQINTASWVSQRVSAPTDGVSLCCLFPAPVHRLLHRPLHRPLHLSCASLPLLLLLQISRVRCKIFQPTKKYDSTEPPHTLLLSQCGPPVDSPAPHCTLALACATQQCIVYSRMARGRTGHGFSTSAGGAQVVEAPGAYSSAQTAKVREWTRLDLPQLWLLVPGDERWREHTTASSLLSS